MTHPRPVHQLPPRKQEILTLLGQGLTYRQVAEKLVLAERTVRTHVSQAKEMTHVRTTIEMVVQLAVWRVRQGLEP